jgi:hypothetical protein
MIVDIVTEEQKEDLGITALNTAALFIIQRLVEI